MGFFTVDFETFTNEDWADSFELNDGEEAIGLAGASLAMRVSGQDGTVIDLSTDNGLIEIVDAAAGEIAICVPKATMADIEPGIYAHDCTLTQEGQAFTLWSGRLVVQQGLAP